MATKRYNKNGARGGQRGIAGRSASNDPNYVRPKKALGQHFLTDMGVARSIAEAMSAGGDVLEVGCGTGVLTQFLLARNDIRTWGAEVDGESVEYLHRHYPDFTPRLIFGDFLNLPLDEMFPEGLKVIGNFPYNISSQIFFKVLDYKELIPEVVGMVQREVALRIASPAGNRDYGILSVLIRYRIPLYRSRECVQPSAKG